MTPERARALRHLLISYAATNGLVFVLSRPWPMRYGLHELIGALFLVAGLVSVRRDDDDTARYGIQLGGIFPGRKGDDRSLVRAAWEALPSAAQEFAVACLVAALVFPVYAYFWPLFNGPVAATERHFTLDGRHLHDIATNLLAVALSEEVYFRGYVQTRLADALGVTPSQTCRPGFNFATAIPIVLGAALFAVTHVTVKATLSRAVVFFPGLLFGVVRTWRRGVGAAVFLHALSNLFEQWLEGS